ncbi:MAG TPA: hypothetical protein VEA99_03945 [Gemmatimonadaceae bacterium]|nr:hypothetical protein [Gemmatimonadaceae bacterium]
MSPRPADPPPLEALAREVFALFPRCVRCGQRIERYEEADVRIFSFRVVHARDCTSGARLPAPG